MKKILIILLAFVFIMSVPAATVFAEIYIDGAACELTEGTGLAEVSPPFGDAFASAAPNTGNMSIIVSLAVLIVTAFITIKLTRQKNKNRT